MLRVFNASILIILMKAHYSNIFEWFEYFCDSFVGDSLCEIFVHLSLCAMEGAL